MGPLLVLSQTQFNDNDKVISTRYCWLLLLLWPAHFIGNAAHKYIYDGERERELKSKSYTSTIQIWCSDMKTGLCMAIRPSYLPER